ncbi:MAG: glycosyltransferase family 4 protein [Bacteroidales bacterium]|nr:glycosyltransferase family 4 protein [Bacteroidales bacterium]
MKDKIAKILLIATLSLIVISYLPWVYLTAVYYIIRYVIMAFMATTVVLTFSLERYASPRFMRYLLLTILFVGVEFLAFMLAHKHFRLEDLFQLVVVFLCVGIGTGLDFKPKTWANICFYYTIGLGLMIIANCFYFAGGLYVPEFYMVNEGKNQMGGLLSISAAALFFWGMKMKEERRHFMIVFALAFLLLILIRARADLFALIICSLFVFIKESELHLKANVKTVVGILCLLLIGYILYNGFVKDELTRFMFGGHGGQTMEQATTHRWERNKMGLDFVSEHVIEGEQEEESGISLIHNYPLLRMVRYGIFSFPLLAFYLFFVGHVAYHLFRQRRTSIRDVGYVVCMVPLIVSLAEPSFPYGPGSVQMLAFLLLGASFRWNQQPEDEEARVLSGDGEVLHICNDFANSKVHAELYQHLDEQGVSQVVYTPLRDAAKMDANRFEGQRTRFVYDYVLRPWHRFFFHRKIEKIAQHIIQQVDLSQVSCVHATTLFSDGAVALYLKQHYGIPFVVAVRNTDVNDFLRYAPHLWWVHRAVLKEASRVVCISPALQQDFMRHFTLLGIRQEVEAKMEVICNGINRFWLESLALNPEQHGHNHQVVYVGNFSDNKNVKRLAEAVLSLKPQIPDIQLHLIGAEGSQETLVRQMAQEHADTIVCHGPIYDKPVLRQHYQASSVFAMPSLTETFGLVYLEAMSQGLSVLYTRGEGIDGLFSEKVGEAVDARSTEDIARALQCLLLQPQNYQTLPESRFQDFDWSAIAQRYKTMYESL